MRTLAQRTVKIGEVSPNTSPVQNTVVVRNITLLPYSETRGVITVQGSTVPVRYTGGDVKKSLDTWEAYNPLSEFFTLK